MKKLVSILFTIFLLSACIPTGFSPEAAARSAVMNNSSGAAVDSDTLVTHQTQRFDEETFVLFSFQQEQNNRVEDCMFLYAVHKSPIGTWVPSHGGGGCSGPVEIVGGGDMQTPPIPPMQTGGGASSGGRQGDPGSTQSYGLVNNDSIVRVRATWSDGVTNEADVVNSSFLFIRAGQHDMPKIEGLDKDGAVVFFQDPPVGSRNKQ